MGRLMEKAGDKAHQRNIDIATYPVDESRIVVEGRLVDRRLKDYYLVTGEKNGAGEIHHMVVRILVEGLNMTIEDVEVDLVTVPREECGEVRESLALVKGVRIIHGFSEQVRNLLGGVKSCTHLVTLLLAMGPAALQGLWSYKSQKPINLSSPDIDQVRIERLMKTLVNTCHVWRSDGPAFKKLTEYIDGLRGGKN